MKFICRESTYNSSRRSMVLIIKLRHLLINPPAVSFVCVTSPAACCCFNFWIHLCFNYTNLKEILKLSIWSTFLNIVSFRIPSFDTTRTLLIHVLWSTFHHFSLLSFSFQLNIGFFLFISSSRRSSTTAQRLRGCFNFTTTSIQASKPRCVDAPRNRHLLRYEDEDVIITNAAADAFIMDVSQDSDTEPPIPSTTTVHMHIDMHEHAMAKVCGNESSAPNPTLLSSSLRGFLLIPFSSSAWTVASSHGEERGEA